MAAKIGPTIRRIQLGLQMRRLREGLDLTLKQAVDSLGISDTTLHRIETGTLNFRNAGDLRLLLELYEVGGEEAMALTELNREAPGKDWLPQYSSVMATGMPSYVSVETIARKIRAYHPTVIYGLLQSEEYARRQFLLSRPIEDTTMDFISQNVKLRMERKEVLTRKEDPMQLSAIISEDALRWTLGDPDVMRGQYAEIAKLSGLDNVRIQVLPQSSKGYRSINDFAVLDLGSGLPSMVQTDTAWGPVAMTDKPREVDRFNRRFDAMTASALAPEDTPEFMQRLQRELE